MRNSRAWGLGLYCWWCGDPSNKARVRVMARASKYVDYLTLALRETHRVAYPRYYIMFGASPGWSLSVVRYLSCSSRSPRLFESILIFVLLASQPTSIPGDNFTLALLLCLLLPV